MTDDPRKADTMIDELAPADFDEDTNPGIKSPPPHDGTGLEAIGRLLDEKHAVYMVEIRTMLQEFVDNLMVSHARIVAAEAKAEEALDRIKKLERSFAEHQRHPIKH
jgi:hypothetical protein